MTQLPRAWCVCDVNNSPDICAAAHEWVNSIMSWCFSIGPSNQEKFKMCTNNKYHSGGRYYVRESSMGAGAVSTVR